MNYFVVSSKCQINVQWFSSFHLESISTLPRLWGKMLRLRGHGSAGSSALGDLPEGVAVPAAWQLVYPRAWQCMQRGSWSTWGRGSACSAAAGDSWSTWGHGSACSAAAGLPEGVAVRAAQQLVYLMARQLAIPAAQQLVCLRTWQCL